MLGVALTLFAGAVVGGITIAALRLRGSPRPPRWLALGHGVIAAAGLAFLIYEALTVSLGSLALAALAVLILAALGGAFMFVTFDLQDKPLPIILVLGHGLIALAGFAMLAIYHYQTHEWGLRP